MNVSFDHEGVTAPAQGFVGLLFNQGMTTSNDALVDLVEERRGE